MNKVKHQIAELQEKKKTVSETIQKNYLLAKENLKTNILKFQLPKGIILTTHEILCSLVDFGDTHYLKDCFVICDEVDMPCQEGDGFYGVHGLMLAKFFYGNSVQSLNPIHLKNYK